MHSFPADATGSWFVVKIVVALSPVLAFGTADVIGWFLCRTLRVAHQSEGERPRDEPAGAAARRGEAQDGLLTG
jgi:hypothetical protein